MTDSAGLIVSFWEIGLSNFPEGTFSHRKLPSDEAVRLINEAKETGKVAFTTEADIGAPYRKRELGNTKELAGVLAGHFGIKVAISDFFSDVGDGMTSALPASLYDIRPDRPMLVVSCHYVRDREISDDDLGMSVEPDSVTFHLFEVDGE